MDYGRPVKLTILYRLLYCNGLGCRAINYSSPSGIYGINSNYLYQHDFSLLKIHILGFTSHPPVYISVSHESISFVSISKRSFRPICFPSQHMEHWRSVEKTYHIAFSDSYSCIPYLSPSSLE
jgi:hypothetical protein